MNLTMTGERTTATFSTLVAIAILGAAVTAQPAGSPAVDRLTNLESDLRFQLDLAYRHDGSLLRERLSQLDAAIETYRLSPQSEADGRVLAGWLRESIIRSLPGDLRELPETPTFSSPPGHAVATIPAPEAAGQPSTPPSPELADSTENESPQPTTALKPTPAPPQPATPKPQANIAANNAAPAIKPAATIAPAPPLVDLTPRVEPQPEAPAAERSVAVSKPPAPAIAASAVSNQRPVDPPAKAPTPLAAPSVAAPVTVNLAELKARIDGYHDGLAEVEAAALAGDQVSREQVNQLVTEVEQLASQYQFVRLYYDALTEAERRSVAAPQSPAATVELVDQQRASLPQASGEDFLQSLDEADDAGDDLARRLRAVAEAVAE